MESDTNECVIIQCNKKNTYWKERTGHLLRKKATEFAKMDLANHTVIGNNVTSFEMYFPVSLFSL